MARTTSEAATIENGKVIAADLENLLMKVPEAELSAKARDVFGRLVVPRKYPHPFAQRFENPPYKHDRADLHGLAELIVSKQRNGPTGKIKLAFLHKYVKFENLAEHVGAEEEAPF